MINNNTFSVISKIWAFCNTLRDNGIEHGDYLEQRTYLLFFVGWSPSPSETESCYILPVT